MSEDEMQQEIERLRSLCLAKDHAIQQLILQCEEHDRDYHHVTNQHVVRQARYTEGVK